MPVHIVDSFEGPADCVTAVEWIEEAGESLVSVVESRGKFLIFTSKPQRAKPKGVEKRPAS